MNWNTFITRLQQAPEAKLQFQYADNSRVNPNYHITELKLANITSVDCGGRLDAWPELVVQIWEPETVTGEGPMEVKKALKIMDIVEGKMSIPPAARVKIEYGNAGFPTRQMPVESIEMAGGELIVHLVPDTTQCKAGDVCGKPKIKLSELSPSTAACCNPETGCC